MVLFRSRTCVALMVRDPFCKDPTLMKIRVRINIIRKILNVEANFKRIAGTSVLSVMDWKIQQLAI